MQHRFDMQLQLSSILSFFNKVLGIITIIIVHTINILTWKSFAFSLTLAA